MQDLTTKNSSSTPYNKSEARANHPEASAPPHATNPKPEPPPRYPIPMHKLPQRSKKSGPTAATWAYWHHRVAVQYEDDNYKVGDMYGTSDSSLLFR